LKQAEAIVYNKASFSGLQGCNLFLSFDEAKQKTDRVYDFISMNFWISPGSYLESS
jgi:hypothetical protein